MSIRLPPNVITWIKEQTLAGVDPEGLRDAIAKTYGITISNNDLKIVLGNAPVADNTTSVLEPSSLIPVTAAVEGVKTPSIIQTHLACATSMVPINQPQPQARLTPQSIRANKTLSPARNGRDPCNHYVEEFIQDRYYVIPGHGLRRFLGIDDVMVLGAELTVMKFIDSKNKHTSMLSTKEVLQAGIREVLSPEEMNELLQKLENGKALRTIAFKRDFNITSINKKFRTEIDWIIYNKDVFAMADILCDFFGRKPQQLPERGAKEQLALKVIDDIADEYAIVMGVSFDEALRIINDKCGYSRFLEARRSKNMTIVSRPTTPLLPPP